MQFARIIRPSFLRLPFLRRPVIRRFAALVGVPLLLGAVLVAGLALPRDPAPSPAGAPTTAPAETAPPQTPTAAPSVPAASPAPVDLPIIDYEPAPGGFPADPRPLDTTPLTEGLTPSWRIPVYDAPGGRPLAYLPPKIRGVPLTTPIVERRQGWTAVLLPSANRRLAWLPPGDAWTIVPLRHQLVVERRAHRLTWYRDGQPVRSWRVSLGMPGQSTPLGRTFILGRTPPPEAVYGGVDVFALGAVPDDPDAVPASLRGAHIGVHGWYTDDTLGQDVTNGCIRLTRSGQRQLLAEVPPGTSLVVVDALPTPAV